MTSIESAPHSIVADHVRRPFKIKQSPGVELFYRLRQEDDVTDDDKPAVPDVAAVSQVEEYDGPQVTMDESPDVAAESNAARQPPSAERSDEWGFRPIRPLESDSEDEEGPKLPPDPPQQLVSQPLVVAASVRPVGRPKRAPQPVVVHRVQAQNIGPLATTPQPLSVQNFAREPRSLETPLHLREIVPAKI